MEVSPTDTYLSYFISRPFWDVWNLFLLGLARILPTIAIAPFLGAKMLPDSVKVAFGITIVSIFLPFMIATATTSLSFDIRFMFLLIKEVAIGALLGLIISMPFFICQGAGSLVDHQRGSQSLQIMDPITQTQTLPTGTFYNNMMLVAFFSIGGPILFFDAVYTSYAVIPADQFLNPNFFESTRPLWMSTIKLTSVVVKISVQLAAPALIAMLMSDLFLGIANRMAPQVQISFLLWSLKSFTGIAILWVSWWFILKQFDSLGMDWIRILRKIIDGL